MEAAGLGFSVAQTLLATLTCPELKDFFLKWNYQSELENLKGTVRTAQAVLRDAEYKEEEDLSHCARQCIEDLKDALYDADDLLDEVATLAQQQHQLHGQGHKKFLRKVRRSFSRLLNFKVAYSMSHEVMNIRKKLDLCTTNATEFGLKVNYQPITMSRKETCSVTDKDIMGREDDQRRIVDLFLDPNSPQVDPVLAVVGVGGLGKTALAQLVYNDDRISKEFGDRKFWVCVSDQDLKQNNKAMLVLANVLQSVTNVPQMGDLKFESVVQQLKKELGEDKYLLVLDDVWTEDYSESQKWLNILTGQGGKGSKILVTTRSKKTAMAVGCNRPYELKGLSDVISWHLFETMVGIELANNHELVDMGKDIVKKCVNVPLAIKVVGSFLRGQKNKDIWRSTQQSVFSSKTKENGDDIMSILKFSYYHLSPPQRSCFTYCAIFPEDYVFKKNVILKLWIANNYVIKDEGQDIEATAEYFFQILVQRCFFQDVKKRENVRVVTFKIHDLMHEMARKIARNEIAKANSTPSNLDKKIRHLYNTDLDGCAECFMATAKLRSFFGLQFPLSALLKNSRTLWVLVLSRSNITQIHDSIGELFHLRYLDFSRNKKLKRLPESLSKLINLQFLDVRFCDLLKELPKDFSRLVNLRTLGVECGARKVGLEFMPMGMEKMSCLIELDRFTFGHKMSNLFEQDADRVRGLRGLGKLRGLLKIKIKRNYKHTKETDGKGGYLCNAEHLTSIDVQWTRSHKREIIKEASVSNDEDLLEDLQPHRNLKELHISMYPGVNVPKWAKENNLTTHLPNLVRIDLFLCYMIRELPRLSKLQYLKTLTLACLDNLEFIEDETSRTSTSDVVAPLTLSNSSTFFPSLEQLCFKNLPKLKGWWRGSYMPMDASFPRLSSLCLSSCPILTSIPLCPTVETVELLFVGEELQIIKEEESCAPKIKRIETSNVGHLYSLPKAAFQCLKEMVILDWDLKSLSVVEAVFQCCSSSLQRLRIGGCENLRNFSGLEYLTNLEVLFLNGQHMSSVPAVIQNLTSLKKLDVLYGNPILKERCKEPDGEDWPIVQHISQLDIDSIW